MGNNLTNHSHTRPADPNWVLGKPAALTCLSHLRLILILLEASVTTGVAALTTELRKHSSNDTMQGTGLGLCTISGGVVWSLGKGGFGVYLPLLD